MSTTLPYSYRIPVSATDITYEVKKSRFIARVAHVSHKADAGAQLAAAKRDYPDARHHCWAYQLGPPQAPTSAAMADDGEPSGTAGKPILNVLQHKDIGDIMIIVIRYFGGIKLGAGGLVRAYSSAAQLAIDHLTTELQVAKASISLCCAFHQEHLIRHHLAQLDATEVTAEYQEQVQLSASLPQENIAQFARHCESLGVILTQHEP